MSRKKKSLHYTVTDLFCGAGGNSIGVDNLAQRYAGGLEVTVAANHDVLCVASHAENFPRTHHICADIQQTKPRQLPSTTFLIASPECTKHTNAEGKKRINQLQPELWGENAPSEAEVRSRTTMMSVPEYAEHHQYEVVIVENVVEARYWVGWRSWLQYMFDLGYEHQVCYFNSMFFHPTPQSRDRMYVVFHKKGNRKPDLEYRPIAPCLHCVKNVEAQQWTKPNASEKRKYKSQYLYVCSTCAKPVTPYFYAAMNAIDWSIPGERIGDRKKPLKDNTMDRIRYGLKKYGGRPIAVRTPFGSGVDCRVRDLVGKPLDTQPGSSITALVHPHFMVDGGLSHGKVKAQSGEDAISTQTTAQTKGVAYTIETKYSHAGPERANAVDEVMRSQTTQQSMGLVQGPMMVDTNHFSNVVRPVDQPLNTQTTAGKMGVAMPEEFVVKLRGSGEDHLKKSSSGLDEPAGTMSAGGTHHSVVSSRAFISPFYNSPQANSVSGPMPTMATIAGHALLDPAEGDSCKLDEVYETFDTGRKKKVKTRIVLGAQRTTSFTSSEPVIGKRPILVPNVDHLYFRMLTSAEIGRAMAFPTTYKVLGNERERVRQYGNAVTPPVMEWIMERCIDSLR